MRKERCAVMATRRTAPSLKRRLAWTLASVAMIGLISLISIVYRSKKPLENQEPGLLTNAETQSEVDHALPLNQPTAKSTVVQAVAVESSEQSRHVNNLAEADAHHDSSVTTSGAFVEQTPGLVPAGNFHSPHYGYHVNLSGMAWTHWDDLTAVVPEAEWGALLKNYGRFLVIPVDLSDAVTSPAEVDRALLAQLGFEYPGQRPIELDNFQRQGAEGHVFRLTREISGRENIYRIWIIRRERVAYLVAAWIDRTAALNYKNAETLTAKNFETGKLNFDAEIEAQLNDVLSRFKLDDSTTSAGEQNIVSQRHLLHRASHLRSPAGAAEN